MPMLLQWSETIECGATIKLDSGEIVHVSVGRWRVTVRQWDLSSFAKMVASRFFGPTLYKDGSGRRNALVADELRRMYPEGATALLRFTNPRLAAFANALWHCRSAAEAGIVLSQAARY
jgi:hypothetical protein